MLIGLAAYGADCPYLGQKLTWRTQSLRLLLVLVCLVVGAARAEVPKVPAQKHAKSSFMAYVENIVVDKFPVEIQDVSAVRKSSHIDFLYDHRASVPEPDSFSLQMICPPRMDNHNAFRGVNCLKNLLTC